MAIEFDEEKMKIGMTQALIISQASEILNEVAAELAGDFGVSKGLAKKIINSYAADSLEKTSEKIEDDRSSLANAEMLIQACENISFDAEEALEEAGMLPKLTSIEED